MNATSLPYLARLSDRVSSEWTEKAAKLQNSGDLVAELLVTDFSITTLRVFGTCPRCPDDPAVSLLLTQPAPLDGRRRFTKTAQPVAQAKTVDCACTGDHAKDRPAGVTSGCGAQFTVQATVRRLP